MSSFDQTGSEFGPTLPRISLTFRPYLLSKYGISMGQYKPTKPIALVVEDDPMIRMMATRLLEQSGMGVSQCESAEEALELLGKNNGRFALMFTDVNLSGTTDGVELAHYAHHHYPNLHIIITSARRLRTDLPPKITFWPKPWKPADLRAHAKRMLLDPPLPPSRL